VTGFTVSTRLAGTLAAAFAASLDVDLHVRSMAASGERAIAGVTSGQLGPGQTVTWRARHFGVPWQLTSRISEYERPTRFVDEQVRGPFRSWRHEHRFAADPAAPGMVLMTDVVEFTAPGGPFGALAAVTILRPYLRKLIRQRNTTLRAVLSH
jgi:ligand-binding SRPBCC domain-containing protein